MPNCAFLSISNTEGWIIDDDLVNEPLQELNWNVQNVPWDQPTDWNSFDVVIIRSTWDYQNHLPRFLEVLKEIEDSKAILLNSLDLVKWNVNKNYLFELAAKGVKLVPTVKRFSLSMADIESTFDAFGTDEIIVKPMIGACADDNFRIKREQVSNFSQLPSVFEGRECMIQPFMQNILLEGEFSLIYFQGKFSHSLLKTVKSGDYRVQEEHGGGVTPVEKPEEQLLQAADKAISALDKMPFYARVDLVRTPDHSFALMELEMIEPCLYFRFGKDAPSQFAACIDAYWRANKSDSLCKPDL